MPDGDGSRSEAAPTEREELRGVFRAPEAGALPGELEERFETAGADLRRGGEADLWQVVERRANVPRLLKLYRSSLELKPEILERIRVLGRDRTNHIVSLLEFGKLADGRWFEVLEFLEGGDLRRLRDSHGGRLAGGLLDQVIEQMHAGIRSVHAAGLAHHDVKPDNFLIRSAEPFDLVLSDFGLAVLAEGQVVYASNRDATLAYQAPETMAQQGGAARDYWAMGVTIAMLATGKEPYAGLRQRAILDRHYRQDPAPLVGEIEDLRVRRLCEGLTRYDVATRWGESQVSDWCSGADRAVDTDR